MRGPTALHRSVAPNPWLVATARAGRPLVRSARRRNNGPGNPAAGGPRPQAAAGGGREGPPWAVQVRAGQVLWGQWGFGGGEAVALTVGCEFGLNSLQPATAVVQVAPCLQAGVCISAERWETSAGHHSYVDHYGNRCERFELAAGGSNIGYEAPVGVPRPRNLNRALPPETPDARLPPDGPSFPHPSAVLLSPHAR